MIVMLFQPIVEWTLPHTPKELSTVSLQHEGQVISLCLLPPPLVAMYAFLVIFCCIQLQL